MASQPSTQFQTKLHTRKSAAVSVPQSCATTILPPPRRSGTSCNTPARNITGGPEEPLNQLWHPREGQEPFPVTESCWARRGGSHGPRCGSLNTAGRLQLCTPSPVSTEQLRSSLQKTSDRVTPLVNIPRWFSIMHGMKIQICQQGELDSCLYHGGLILWPANIGLPCLPASGCCGQWEASMGTLGQGGK